MRARAHTHTHTCARTNTCERTRTPNRTALAQKSPARCSYSYLCARAFFFIYMRESPARCSYSYLCARALSRCSSRKSPVYSTNKSRALSHDAALGRALYITQKRAARSLTMLHSGLRERALHNPLNIKPKRDLFNPKRNRKETEKRPEICCTLRG